MGLIKKVFKKIKKVLVFFFKNIWYSLLFILDNSIGLVFNKCFTKYNTKLNNESLWKKVRTILLILLLLVFVFGFKYIYDHTFYIIIKQFLKLLGRPFKNNILGEVLIEHGGSFAEGIGTTLYLSLIGTTVGFIFALFLSLTYFFEISPFDSKTKVFFKVLANKVVKIYVSVIRGTPMMVQAMILYYSFVNLLSWTPLVAGLTIVSLNTTAYLTEVLRGGIESIDKGQTEGALSLGLSKFQTMMYVVFPQAVKNSMASIGNEFIINIKDTSVLNVIMVVDLYYQSSLIYSEYLNTIPLYISAVIYLLLTTITTSILRKIEKSFDIPTKVLPSGN